MARQENPNGSTNNTPSKILVIGDEGCGKTSLIYSYLEKPLPDGTRKIPCKEYAAKVHPPGVDSYETIIWDVPMAEQYATRRIASYAKSDAVLLCFAINDPPSLEHACTRWLNELKQYTPGTPIILVGLKKDLRPSLSEVAAGHLQYVPFQSAYEQKDIHHFKEYLECSAKHGEGVYETFTSAGNILVSQGIWL